MKKARFSHTAQSDLIAIARYIADTSGSRSTASAFATALRQKCHKLANAHAVLGRARDELVPNLRSLAFKSYVIFFRYDADQVDVVTILHGMRDIDAHFDSE